MSWQIGARVLAGRAKDSFLYPATIRWLDGAKVAVDYDDGEQAWLSAGQVTPWQLEVGDRVFARLPVGRTYSPARITRIEGSKIHIEYDDGEPEWTSPGLLRILPEQWKNQFSERERLPGSEWIPGDRVLAQWVPQDPFWYPGTIQMIEAKGLEVYFDDGDHASVPPDKVKRVDIDVGGRVFARWQGGPAYYPARVVGKDGDKILVRYDDTGEEEKTTISLVRVRPSAVANPWHAGDRVLAHWPPEPFFYSGIVAAVNDDMVLIHFDDGDKAQLTLEEVLPLAIRAGDRVFARWQGGKTYSPARVIRQNGEKIQVNYEDGRTENTTIGLVRVLPGNQ